MSPVSVCESRVLINKKKRKLSKDETPFKALRMAANAIISPPRQFCKIIQNCKKIEILEFF